ncbi:Protein kinase [Entamoeba marina]
MLPRQTTVPLEQDTTIPLNSLQTIQIPFQTTQQLQQTYVGEQSTLPGYRSYDSVGTLNARNALISEQEVMDYVRRGEPVGEGSFGIVYQSSLSSQHAQQRQYSFQRVAIKVLKEQNLRNDEKEQFMVEMSILSQLSHPNIVTFFKACVNVPFLSILTEYISNGTLRHYLQTQSLSLLRGLSIMKQIASGMSYLHNHEPIILHLDLKSDNILVSGNGVIKITDFGLSFFVNENAPHKNNRVIRGTPGYCSPESIDVSLFNSLPPEMKKKSDIFSFGIVFWEVVNTCYVYHYSKPYEEYPNIIQNPYALMNQISSDIFMLRPSLPSQCDSDVSTLIEMCYAHHYDSRPDFNDILDLLEEYIAILRVKETPQINQSKACMTPMNKLDFVDKNTRPKRSEIHIYQQKSRYMAVPVSHSGQETILREYLCYISLYFGDAEVLERKSASIKIVIESSFQLSLQFKFKEQKCYISC